MRPYIARVCGFARGEAECKTTNECIIWAHNARVWYLVACYVIANSSHWSISVGYIGA